MKCTFADPLLFFLNSYVWSKGINSVFLSLIINFTFLLGINQIHVLNFLMLKGLKSYIKSHGIYIMSDIFNVLNKGIYYFPPACPQGVALLHFTWCVYQQQPAVQGLLPSRQLTAVLFCLLVCFSSYSSPFPSGLLRTFFLIFPHVTQYTLV